MHKEVITYNDYNGITRTGEFWFNLSDAELTEMEMSVNGGYAEMLRRISMTEDMPSLIAIFKEIITKSYGERDIDGIHFRKSEKILSDFTSTEAYSVLFMKLATNAKAAADFVNGVIPENRKQALAQLNASMAPAMSVAAPTPVAQPVAPIVQQNGIPNPAMPIAQATSFGAVQPSLNQNQ